MRRFERSKTRTSGWRRSCETPTSGEQSCRGRLTSSNDDGDQHDGDGGEEDDDDQWGAELQGEFDIFHQVL